MKMEAEIGVTTQSLPPSLQPKEWPTQVGGGKEGFSPTAFSQSVALPPP